MRGSASTDDAGINALHARRQCNLLDLLLHRARFFDGKFDEELGIKDLAWPSPASEEMIEEDWHNPQARTDDAVRWPCVGQQPAPGRCWANVTLLMLLNASPDEVVFHLPVVQGEYWRVRADTAACHAQLAVPAGAGWAAVGRSLVEQDSVPH